MSSLNPAAYELAVRQAELSFNVEKTEHIKETKKHTLEKQQLAGDLVDKFATSVITKLEQADDWKQVKLVDPVEILPPVSVLKGEKPKQSLMLQNVKVRKGED